jgi:ankyrin repeat protein
MKFDVLGVPDVVANRLLDAGSPRGTLMWTPLQYASALGDEELARELLVDKESDANERGRTKFGYTPLHVAVRFGHESILDLLLVAAAPWAAWVSCVIAAMPNERLVKVPKV